MTDLDDSSPSRSRSRARQLKERLIEEIAPSIAKQMDGMFIKFSAWLPSWVNLAYFDKHGYFVLADIYQDTNLVWIWDHGQWMFFDGRNPYRVYHFLNFYMNHNGYWDFVVARK